MATLREVIKTLNDENRDLIMKAFDQEKAHLIELGTDNLFVGVNLEDKDDYEIIEESGCWTMGRFKSNG